MFEVRMPREIRAYKEKIALGMTKRQLLCNGIAVVICVPTYIYGRKVVSEDSIIWFIFLIASILGLIGHYTKNGLNLEKYIMVVLQHSFINPQRRTFATEKKMDRINNLKHQDVINKLSLLSVKGEK